MAAVDEAHTIHVGAGADEEELLVGQHVRSKLRARKSLGEVKPMEVEGNRRFSREGGSAKAAGAAGAAGGGGGAAFNVPGGFHVGSAASGGGGGRSGGAKENVDFANGRWVHGCTFTLVVVGERGRRRRNDDDDDQVVAAHQKIASRTHSPTHSPPHFLFALSYLRMHVPRSMVTLSRKKRDAAAKVGGGGPKRRRMKSPPKEAAAAAAAAASAAAEAMPPPQAMPAWAAGGNGGAGKKRKVSVPAGVGADAGAAAAAAAAGAGGAADGGARGDGMAGGVAAGKAGTKSSSSSSSSGGRGGNPSAKRQRRASPDRGGASHARRSSERLSSARKAAREREMEGGAAGGAGGGAGPSPQSVKMAHMLRSVEAAVQRERMHAAAASVKPVNMAWTAAGDLASSASSSSSSAAAAAAVPAAVPARETAAQAAQKAAAAQAAEREAKRSEEVAKVQVAVNIAESHKGKGNSCYSQQNWAEALRWYTLAVDQVKPLLGRAAAVGEAGVEQEVAGKCGVFLCNRAAAALMMGSFAHAATDCTEAIQLQPAYVKAHLRLGRALAGLGMVREARQRLGEVLDGHRGIRADAKEASEARETLRCLDAYTKALGDGEAWLSSGQNSSSSSSSSSSMGGGGGSDADAQAVRVLETACASAPGALAPKMLHAAALLALGGGTGLETDNGRKALSAAAKLVKEIARDDAAAEVHGPVERPRLAAHCARILLRRGLGSDALRLLNGMAGTNNSSSSSSSSSEFVQLHALVKALEAKRESLVDLIRHKQYANAYNDLSEFLHCAELRDLKRYQGLILCHRAEALLGLEKWANVVRDADRALELWPTLDRALVARGKGYTMLDMYGQALADLRRAYLTSPTQWIADHVTKTEAKEARYKARKARKEQEQRENEHRRRQQQKEQAAAKARAAATAEKERQQRRQQQHQQHQQREREREFLRKASFDHGHGQGQRDWHQHGYNTRRQSSGGAGSAGAGGQQRSGHAQQPRPPPKSNHSQRNFNYNGYNGSQGRRSTRSSSSSSSSSGGGSSSSGYGSHSRRAPPPPPAARPTTHYEALGVNNGATARQIKKAYRQMALQYHPDKNSSPSAEAKFKKVREARERGG